MPQYFQVLKCYKCRVFQVHQVKKSSKFECKLCGEKQSIKRHYGLGTGKECRIHVQKLNNFKGEIDNLENSHRETASDELDDDYAQNCNKITDREQIRKGSKWSEYIDSTETCIKEIPSQTNEPMFLGNTEVVLELPKKPRRYKKNSKINDTSTLKTIDEDIDFIDKEKSFKESKAINVKSQIKEEYADDICKPLTQIPKNKCKFFPPVVNKKSKWTKFSDTTKDNIENEDQDLLNDKEMCQKRKRIDENFCQDRESTDRLIVSPPAVGARNSKWAKYADDMQSDNDGELSGNLVLSLADSNSDSKPGKMFSLGDDSDLDSVLDI